MPRLREICYVYHSQPTVVWWGKFFVVVYGRQAAAPNEVLRRRTVGAIVNVLCRLGFHRRLYSDGAFFARATRCGACGEWTDPIAGAAVDRERKGWEDGLIDPSVLTQAPTDDV